VRAILCTVGRLGLEDMIASRPCRERDIVVGMIAERLVVCYNPLMADEPGRAAHGDGEGIGEGGAQRGAADEDTADESRDRQSGGREGLRAYRPFKATST